MSLAHNCHLPVVGDGRIELGFSPREISVVEEAVALGHEDDDNKTKTSEQTQKKRGTTAVNKIAFRSCQDLRGHRRWFKLRGSPCYSHFGGYCASGVKGLVTLLWSCHLQLQFHIVPKDECSDKERGKCTRGP